MLNQKLQQKLTQKLSPQQILLMKLLQIPSIALEQRIKQEIEENPVLEDLSESESSQAQENDSGESSDENDDFDKESTDTNEEFDLSDYIQDDDDIPAYRTAEQNTSRDYEPKQAPFISSVSFHEQLLAQLGLRDLDSVQLIIAQTIIGNLDDAGYLQRDLNAMVDDLAFSQNLITNTGKIEEVLKVVQDLDPPGIAARNLRECLLLQLKRRDQTPAATRAIHVLEDYFEEFTKKHFDKIIKKAQISEEELKEAIDEVLRLNPKPGDTGGENQRQQQYVIPDFVINNVDGELMLTLNSKNAPELRLNRTYLDMLEAYTENKNKNSQQQKETVMFIKQKIDSARWFIDAIKQRQNTLYVTMKVIMDYQHEYFLEGDETKLRPMILKDIAEIVNLDISTVSRVANSKYVQTPHGTYLLKSFFSESMQTDSGEEVSTREIKKILSNCIEAESKHKPLTDDQLTEILKAKGYNIARRTVAKYREQLNISVARLRKELK
ncbi:MAG: RNA polymerase factor sigma-54 [Bacteroidales bacterium]|nr:RNA polymerase factor sigma-54 [Bacteroidales bacterium]MDZ4205075.1 RNA polymerase factor sigma-54 [Bacteroidales bacterium]